MKRIAAPIMALFLALFLAGCETVATTPDMFAVVQGDGSNGNDAKVREVAYPGEVIDYNSTTEEVYYFPGNTRNYMISTGEKADRQNPATGRTKDGTPVKVFLTAKWAVNQDRSVIENNFVPYCYKFLCMTEDPTVRDSELGAASAGWADMLATDFSPAVDAAVREAMPGFSDDVWTKQENWTELEEAISEKFTGQMRRQTSQSVDLFCGGGDASSWSGGAMGEGTYNCSPVTFVVSEVSAVDDQQQRAVTEAASSEAQIEANEATRRAAEAKYGERAGEYLAQQDAIRACQSSETCTVVIGDPQVSPPSQSAPTEEPTE